MKVEEIIKAEPSTTSGNGPGGKQHMKNHLLRKSCGGLVRMVTLAWESEPTPPSPSPSSVTRERHLGWWDQEHRVSRPSAGSWTAHSTHREGVSSPRPAPSYLLLRLTFRSLWPRRGVSVFCIAPTV